MQDSKFYYAGKHPAILKSLVYKIECARNEMNGVVFSYTISFYLLYQDQVITWSFDDEDMRDKAYGNVLDASMDR